MCVYSIRGCKKCGRVLTWTEIERVDTTSDMLSGTTHVPTIYYFNN